MNVDELVLKLKNDSNVDYQFVKVNDLLYATIDEICRLSYEDTSDVCIIGDVENLVSVVKDGIFDIVKKLLKGEE